jgi:hypothetical protein
MIMSFCIYFIYFVPYFSIHLFQSIQLVLSLAAANSREPRWQPTGKFMCSRFWLLENLLNSSYKEFYIVSYRYYWNRLGKMHEYAISVMKKDTYGSCEAGVFSAESTQ